MKRCISLSLIALALAGQAHGQGSAKSTGDVVGQGPGGAVVAEDGATVIRTKNGVSASLSMPTPVPGTYIYPDSPFVYVGAPEAFTGWIFFFNNPALCSDGVCGSDDLGPTPAMGGAYNLAGHMVGGSTLNLAGHVSVGADAFGGVPLSNPMGAEIHVAVAPHGMVLPEILPDQITTPIGTPDLWWLAFFFVP